MRLSERLGFGPKSYEFPRPTGDTKYDRDLERWPITGPLAVGAWVRQTFDRQRSLSGVFKSLRDREESVVRHVLEGIEFVGRMEVGDLASNGLRSAVLWDNRDNSQKSEFGTILTRAYNNPAHSDHNHEHSRRHERWLESMLLNIGELRHSHSIFEWIDSTLLTSYWHDADQLISLERNFVEGTDLPVKKGHGLGAAVMLLALHNRYAVERKVSVHRAWEICAGAALMSIKHDKPEELSQALSGTRAAYEIDDQGNRTLLHSQELERAFDANELDLFSLAPSQLMEILKRKKVKAGFVKKDAQNTWGLHPAFEQEYQQELASLAGNTLPIIKDITPEGRSSFRHAAEAVVLADVFDMVTPPVESIFRSLNTQYSQNRPFFRADMDVAHQLELINQNSGNIDRSIDSDARRMFWELVHMEHIKEGIIAQNRFVHSVNRNNAVMGVLAFRDIGKRIMSGDLSDIDVNYNRRKAQIARKTLGKASVSRLQKMPVYRKILESGDDGHVESLLEKTGNHALARLYREKVNNLTIEADTIRFGFLQKPDSTSPGVHIYSPEDIASFEAICDTITTSLCDKYGVSPKRLKRFKAKAIKGRYSQYTPYVTYDSIGNTPRTLVAPLGVANST